MQTFSFPVVAASTAATPDTRPRGMPTQMADQMKWHTVLSDQFKNFYRTSYQDQILGREVAVKSAKPEGYGGYDVYKGANELYRNTEFDKMQQVIKNDETRFRLPDFTRQKEGLPDYTSNPKGKSTVKSAHTVPKTGFVVPPYSVDQFGVALNIRSHVPILPSYEQRQPNVNPAMIARSAVPQRAMQPASTAGLTEDVTGAAKAPKLLVQTDAQDTAAKAPKLLVQTDVQDEAYLPAPSSESARLSAAATYVLNNGTRSPRKGGSPRHNPKQLIL